MKYSRITSGIGRCTGVGLCLALVACSDVGTSVISSEPSAANVRPPRHEVSVYTMAITLEDRPGDGILSDGGGTYVQGDGAIVELQAWETMDDQMYVKSAPGATSRGGRIALAELDVECGNFQLRVYSSSEFLDVAVGETVFGTGLVMCTPPGSGMKERYQLDIGECIAVQRIAQDAWRAVSDAGCVGRLDQGKKTIGFYEVPFAFAGVLR